MRVEKINLGSGKIANMRVGNTQPDKAFLGTTLVWEKPPYIVKHVFTPAPSTSYTYGVEISMTDDHLAISDWAYNPGSLAQHGRVYIYNRSNYGLNTTLNPPEDDAYQLYGWDIDMNSSKIAVGARQYGSTNKGKWFLHDINSGGLISSREGGADNAQAGSGVGINDSWSVSGEPARQVGAYDPNAGLGNFLDLTGSFHGNLLPPTPEQDEYMGTSVAMTNTYIVMGGNNGSYVRLHVFDMAENFVRYLTQPDPDGARFGFNLEIHGDYVVTSCPQQGTLAGSVYVYNVTTGDLLQQWSGLDDSQLGTEVAVYGNYALAGTYDNKVFMYDITTGDEVMVFEHSAVEFGQHGLGINGNQVAIAAKDQVILFEYEIPV